MPIKETMTAENSVTDFVDWRRLAVFGIIAALDLFALAMIVWAVVLAVSVVTG